MTTVLVYSDASANLAKVLDIGNFSWKAIDALRPRANSNRSRVGMAQSSR